MNDRLLELRRMPETVLVEVVTEPVSDETDPFRDGEIRTREFNAGALFPWRRVRSSQSVLAAFNASRDACLAALTSLTDEALDEKMSDPFGNDSTRGGMLGILSATCWTRRWRP